MYPTFLVTCFKLTRFDPMLCMQLTVFESKLVDNNNNK